MQLIIPIVTPFDFPRQVEYSCVISLSAASLPRTITRRTSRHATIPNATARRRPTVFMRGRRRARTSDLMIRSPPPRWDTIGSNSSLPAWGRIAGYRICEDQSAGDANVEQRPISPNGTLWNGTVLLGLFRLDVRKLHHLGPLFDFLSVELSVVGRRKCKHGATQVGKARLDLGIDEGGV